MKTIMSLAGF